MADLAGTRPLTEPNQLWWALAGGLALWLVIMFVFSHLLSAPEADTVQQPPVEARIIDIPEPKPQTSIPQARPVTPPTPPKPIAKPVVKPHVKEPVTPRSKPVPAPQAPQVERPADKTAEPPSAKASAAPEPPPASKPAPQSSPNTNAPTGTERMGAKAIYQPIPKIPDDLRDEAISTVAMARFHIKPDGSVTVELLKATSNPRLNQLILNTLRTWKFFPAMQDGKPVASTQDIKVSIDVS